MAGQDPIQKDPNPAGTTAAAAGVQSLESLFSPRFKSAAAMAGWDEESILLASLIVEDTPDRGSKQRKRPDPLFKTPPSNTSRRKRRVQRKSPMMPVTVLNLDEEEEEEEEVKESEKKSELKEASSSNAAVLPCMDKLRDELSCAICLEICYEPTTTSCGHSFCKKCLRSAADKCGRKCPKCRQLISNGRSSSCTVNTVLWNTIQLLFPQDVEARKAAGAASSILEPATREERRPGRGVNHGSHDQAQSSAALRGIALLSGREDGGVNHGRQQGRPLHHDQARSSAESERLQRGIALLSGREYGGRVNRGGRQQGRPLDHDQARSSAESERLRRGIALLEGSEEPAALARRVQRRRRTTATTRGGGSGSVVAAGQDGDAALALRLQRQEFMEAFREPGGGGGGLQSARANLRAMASRAVSVRSRGGGGGGGGQYL